MTISDLGKHQSYIKIHMALCDNTKPHEHPAAERFFAEALDDAKLAGMEIERERILTIIDTVWSDLAHRLAQRIKATRQVGGI